MGLNDILFKRTKRKKATNRKGGSGSLLWGESPYTSANNQKESSSETPTESEEPIQAPILQVNSSTVPSIEVLSGGVIHAQPAVVSPGPDLSDVDQPPPLPRVGSEDTEDDLHPGFLLPVDVSQKPSQTTGGGAFRLVDESNLFSAGRVISNYVEDEEDSFYLSATDTEGGPSTLATEDRTVFPNLPSEDDFTASSRSALDSSAAVPLRFNPKTGASLVPEGGAAVARPRREAIEYETKRQLEEAVRQINPIYPRHVVDSDSESSGGNENDNEESDSTESRKDDDEDDTFYLSATDTEGPSSEFVAPKTSLLPALRLSSPTDSPLSAAKDVKQNRSHEAVTRTVASLVPEIEENLRHEHNNRSQKPRAESPRDVASAQPPLPSEYTQKTLGREPTSIADISAPPSPNRAPRITIKTNEAKVSTPLKKLPAPARDVRRKKMDAKLSPKRDKTDAKLSPEREKSNPSWFDPFSFEEWADFGCSSSATQPNQDNPSPQPIKGPKVEGMENLVANAKTKKSSSSISSAPALSHSTIRRARKTACNESVSDVLKTLKSSTSSRRSRSLSASRQASKHFRTHSSDRQAGDQKSHFGISSDLESVSSQSNRSVRSGSVAGGRNTSRHRPISGTESCHSSGQSIKSFTSHMSESSKSIAADLLRLERHLESIGGVQGRPQRSRRSRVTVAAPPGKLGVFLENRKNSKGTVVTKVRDSSPLASLIQTGDRILAIDGADVSLMAVSEITSIMQRTNDHERTLTVLKTSEDFISECEV